MWKRRRGRKRATHKKMQGGPRIERRKKERRRERKRRKTERKRDPLPHEGEGGEGVEGAGGGHGARGAGGGKRKRRRGLGRPKRKFELLNNLNHLLLSHTAHQLYRNDHKLLKY